MIILDTNIISEADKTPINLEVQRWFQKQNPLSLFLCAPLVMEQVYGAERFQYRTGSSRYLRSVDKLVLETFKGRILPFDGSAPFTAGRIRSERERMGCPISVQDTMIAAICVTNGAILATRNVRDFQGIDLKLVNPFEPPA